jgi:hypothetical protein
VGLEKLGITELFEKCLSCELEMLGISGLYCIGAVYNNVGLQMLGITGLIEGVFHTYVVLAKLWIRDINERSLT